MGNRLKKTLVSIVRGHDFKNVVKESLDLLGGLNRFINKDETVLVKPNLTAGFIPDTGATTKPELIKAIVELLWEVGAGRVIIGEGEMNDAFKRSRVEEVADETGCELLNFRHGPFVEVDVPNAVLFKKVRVAKILFDCDKLLSVPVLKTHHLSLITMALKNMYGVIPVEDKIKYHRMDKVEKAIVDINLVRSADLIIVDGLIGEEGLAGGIRTDRPVHMDIVVSGSDSVAIDTICSRIIGLNPEKILHLRWAGERGIGTMNNIEVKGLTIPEVYRKFETPIEHVNEEHEKIKIYDFDSCSGCHGRVASVVNHIKDELLKESVNIYVGQNPVLSERKGVNIFVGDCTKSHMKEGIYIPGCPPTAQSIKDEIEKWIVT